MNYNIELEAHSIIKAEGLEVETFADNVPRSTWDNYEEYLSLCGAHLPIQDLALPRIKFSRQLPAALRLVLQIPQQTSRERELALR